MNSIREIVSSERKLASLKQGDFIYVHPRSSDVVDKSLEKLSYFGRFDKYADEENFYEVDLKVDVEFRCEGGVWAPRKIIRNKGVIERVDTLEDDGYFLYVGKREIEMGMGKHNNPHYDLVREIIHGSIHRSVHGSQ